MSTPEGNTNGGFAEFGAMPTEPVKIQRAQHRSLYDQNKQTVTCLIVVAVYMVIAFTTHFVLIGIFPLLLALRAFAAREALAPLAALGAGLALFVSFTALSGHS